MTTELDDPLKNVTLEIGDTGLNRWGGIITEEFLRQLQGQAGIKLFSEMRDNHPVIGGMLFAIQALVSNCEWHIESPSDKVEDKDAADFVQSCLDDMDHTWEEFLQEALSMLVFGWSFHEQVFKIRQGEEVDEEKDEARSRYDDNKIGWRRLPLRAQETFSRWIFDDHGYVKAFGQWPPKGGERLIPMAKGLLFRTNANKGNPEGRSMLRNSVVPYLTQRKLQEIENVGIERDLAGLPVLYIPAKLMSTTADANERRLLQTCKTILKNIRRDSQEGVLLPSDVDPKSGKAMFEMKLLTSGGQRQIDTTAINKRWDERILMTMLADFMMLGQGRTGSFALSSDKTELFVGAINTFLINIKQTFNRNAIPTLLKLNGFKLETTPVLNNTDIEVQSLGELGTFLGALTAAGMPLFPDPALEDHIRELSGLPKPSPDAALRDVGQGGGKQDPANQDGGQPPSTQDGQADGGSAPKVQPKGPPLRKVNGHAEAGE